MTSFLVLKAPFSWLKYTTLEVLHRKSVRKWREEVQEEMDAEFNSQSSIKELQGSQKGRCSSGFEQK